MRKVTLGRIIAYIVLVLGALSMTIPFLWMISHHSKT